MAAISRSAAALRISGDALVPEHVTDLLGAVPTTSYRKGEVVRLKTGREIVRRTGLWSVKVADEEPENIDGQVAALLARLSQDLAVWRTLASQFELDIFCGLFMNESNEGLTLSSPTMVALAERGIEIGFDIYAPSEKATGSNEDWA